MERSVIVVRGSRKLQFVVAASAGLMWLNTGCFPDFERFEDAPGPRDVGGQDVGDDTAGDAQLDTPVNDASDTALDAPGDVLADVDGDVSEDTPDDVEDVLDEEVTEVSRVGDPCSSSNDCAEDLFCDLDFEGGLCTAMCSGAVLCPEGSTCAESAGVPLCLPSCEGGVCMRGELDCVDWTGLDQEVCASDDDGDAVLDPHDNCPLVANPNQRDTDRDGTGDICDSLPICPEPSATAEVPPRTLSTPPRGLHDAPAVFISELEALAVLGGDLGGEPSAEVELYDAVTAEWTESLPDLPVAAADVAAAWDADRRLLIATTGNAAFSSFLSLAFDENGAPEPTWRVGPDLTATLHDAAVLTTPAGVVVAGWNTDDPDSATLALVTIVWRVENRMLLVGSVPMAGLGGNLVAISDDASNAFFLSTGAANVAISVPILTGVPQRFDLPSPLVADAVADTNAIAFRGDQTGFWFANLDNGIVNRVDLSLGGIVTTAYVLEPTGQSPTIAAAFDPISTSLFGVVSEPTMPLASTLVRWFPGCADIAPADDNDTDAVPILNDNCPITENADQADLDDDGAGDACDDDDDGDGIPDAVDGSLLDTDNDGIPNDSDDDDDGDRLTDPIDQLPLDADNDGVPNPDDDDDDGDGARDIDELAAGSNPFDNLSVPGGNRVVFITDLGGERALQLATFAELADGVEPETVTLDPGVIPAWPRLVDGMRRIVYTDIADPDNPAVIVHDIDVGPGIRHVATGVKADSADYLPATNSIAYVRQGVSWQIETIAIPNIGIATPTAVVTSAEPLYGLAVAESTSTAYFSAGPDCPVCLDIGTAVITSLATPNFPPELDLGLSETQARPWREGNALVLLASFGEATQAWTITGGDPQPVTPDDWDIQSADFAGSPSRVVVSARLADRPQAPWQLYLFDVAAGTFRQLTDRPVPAVECAFAR